MKLSFYFDVYPWTKSSDVIYASTIYRIDVNITDPAQPDEIISVQANEVVEHPAVIEEGQA